MLRFGYPALAATDADYYPATVMNYILGGGGFASQLTQQLREGKGYTYGIDSGLWRNESPGNVYDREQRAFERHARSRRSSLRAIVSDFGKNYSDADLATTKSFLIKSNARAFETAGAKLDMLENISKYGWKYNYVNDREAIVKAMTVDRIRDLSGKYLNTDKMIWLVVGDAKTQLPRSERAWIR